MRKLLGLLLVVVFLLSLPFAARAQEEPAFPIVWQGVSFLDIDGPKIDVIFRHRNDDVLPLTTIALASKTWTLPLEAPLNLDISLSLDGGGMIGENNDGENSIFDATIGSGLMIGGLEQPIAWALEKIPAVGTYLGAFVDALDGRVGYGGTFDLAGFADLFKDPGAAFRQYGDHGLVIGVVQLKLEY